MCQRVTCSECGKASFTGCGRHVEEVLRGVPEDARCKGHAGKEPKSRWAAFVSLFLGI